MNDLVKTWTENSADFTLVGRIRLDRTQALNALDQTMVRAINSALLSWRDNDTVSMVLVDHAPKKRGFCAGADIRKLATAPSPEIIASIIADECTMSVLLHSFPKPIVTVMDGVVMGAGLGLAIHGSHRIATENTILAMPEVGIGLFPDTGVSWHLARLDHRIGMWMAMTGAQLTAAQAIDVGIATHHIPSDRIDTAKTDLVAHGPNSLDRHAVPAGEGFSPQQRALTASLFAADDANAIQVALRANATPWAQLQANAIAEKCPMSVHIAHRHVLTTASGDNFNTIMQAEHALVCAMAERADFREGVRATIIEKDRTPVWSPARLDQVSATSIQNVVTSRPVQPFSTAA